ETIHVPFGVTPPGVGGADERPGVTGTGGRGEPGATASFRLRGATSPREPDGRLRGPADLVPGEGELSWRPEDPLVSCRPLREARGRLPVRWPRCQEEAADPGRVCQQLPGDAGAPTTTPSDEGAS